MSLESNINDYIAGHPARFHMPGHKGVAFCDTFLSEVAKRDITELSFSDNLHIPSGVICDIEHELSDLYGAKRSFLLINGSTAGVIAMLLALGREKRVLLPRNAHRSAISGCILAGHTVIPMENTGSDRISELIAIHAPDAVFITCPTYDGRCPDIEKIAKVCHQNSALLLIDAAHGAHFPFLPEPFGVDISKAADIWVTSLHKTLPALTMTAVLNISARASEYEFGAKGMLNMLQTSSPSYILMQSVEIAISKAKNADWTHGIVRNRSFCDIVNKIDGVSAEVFGDPYRITIKCNAYSGFELQRRLEHEGIFVEMADFYGVVLISTPFDPDEWYERLINVIRKNACKEQARLMKIPPCVSYASEPVDIREFAFRKGHAVKLSDAVGRVAIEPVGAYPPGTAELLPGETVTHDIVLRLCTIKKYGGTLFGVHHGSIMCIE